MINGITERYSRNLAITPSEFAVKAWFCKFPNLLQQAINNSGAFSVFRSYRILSLVSNCQKFAQRFTVFKGRRLHVHSALILNPAKRSNHLVGQFETREYHFPIAEHNSKRSQLEATRTSLQTGTNTPLSSTQLQTIYMKVASVLITSECLKLVQFTSPTDSHQPKATVQQGKGGSVQ